MIKEILAALVLLSVCDIANAEYHRSQKAKSLFKQSHPCPSTGRIIGSCSGYIIDHIKPPSCGGADSPENMEIATKIEAKTNTNGCVKGINLLTRKKKPVTYFIG